MALPLLLIGGAVKALKSPVGKKILGGAKKIFSKKARKKAGNNETGELRASSPVAYTAAMQQMQNLAITQDEQKSDPVSSKINEWLGNATKDSRQINTTVVVDKMTIAYILGGLVAVWFLFFRKKGY
jgi:hypothetical protein